jgi:hypothetical protein
VNESDINESDIEEAALKIENGREKIVAEPSATPTAADDNGSFVSCSTEATKPLYIQ